MEWERNPDGSVSEVAPAACPAGHPWGRGGAVVGWRACQCATTKRGHRTYRCQTEGCDAVIEEPPHRARSGSPSS